FYCHTDSSTFGFIDPDLILQGAHLILQFSKGTVQTLLPSSLTCQPKDKNKDYKFYFVNIFINRDMFMYYQGRGIRHKS
ncbi:uncharacterized protein FOMMEDRAFT_34840, partial [Fomitiporia mediterranea MF3/22]|uniref:uncharacterized protein n=1 Tax=Fomitiporia mediterranea (strain MF3/22) TaxID=694068 RepID=UPI00044096F0